MPEGPEVRRIVDQMSEAISGRILDDVEIISGRYTKKSPDGIDRFLASAPHKITAVRCKGKFIYMLTDSDWSIWSTLGMSGSWMHLSHNYNENKKIKHLRLKFSLEDYDIYFKDMRNFGTIKFVDDREKLDKKLNSLGIDILSEDMSDELFIKKLKNNFNKTLPEILMNQKIVSGIGNYIKAESLYLAKLSPHRKAGSLSDNEASTLNRAIHSVIRESYKSGGSTFKTYSDFNGGGGNFSDRFMVYGRKVDPIGYGVIKEETKDKRVTHWVPQIQK